MTFPHPDREHKKNVYFKKKNVYNPHPILLNGKAKKT